MKLRVNRPVLKKIRKKERKTERKKGEEGNGGSETISAFKAATGRLKCVHESSVRRKKKKRLFLLRRLRLWNKQEETERREEEEEKKNPRSRGEKMRVAPDDVDFDTC